MLVKLVCVERSINGSYVLKEIMLNPKHIVMISEDQSFKRRVVEGQLGLDLHPQVEFTRITISETTSYSKEIVVVGSPHDVESKIFQKSKQLLRG